MRLRRLKQFVTLLVFPVLVIGSEAAETRGQDPSTPRLAASPPALIFELREHRWGSFPPSSQETMVEVQAKPGDGIGQPIYGERPFTLVEILGKDSARIRVSRNLVCGQAGDRFGGTFVLKSDHKLEAGTRSDDAGTGYTLRISDFDKVPVISADDPALIAAIAAHASITKDDFGSVQGVRPPAASGFQGYFTDEDLRNIAKLTNLRRLTFDGKSITAAGYRHLTNMNRLVYLNLSNSNVSDAALSNLSGLNRLEEVALFRTKIGDSGLRYLAKLPRLKILDLGETNVGDEGIKVLRDLKNLESIGLWGSKITRVGFWELHQALPRCLLKPEFLDSGLSGRLERPGSTIGPAQLATETGERERTLLRLLVLGCNLREDNRGKIVEASVTPQQTREVFELLAKLDTVEILNIHCDMDESVSALFVKLKKLRELHLERCHFPEAGWMNVGRLSLLRELHLRDARISGDCVRKLRNLLPNCKIDGADVDRREDTVH